MFIVLYNQTTFCKKLFQESKRWCERILCDGHINQRVRMSIVAI